MPKPAPWRYAGLVGLDVHKETIAVAKLAHGLCADGELFLFCPAYCVSVNSFARRRVGAHS